MSANEEKIVVSSLTKEEVEVSEFIAAAKDLASEQGLAENDIGFEAEQTFPVEGTILIALTFASKVAYDIWKEFILPQLKERYRIKKQQEES